MAETDVDTLRHKLLEAVSDAIKGTDWAPDTGVLAECVVAMSWMDDHGDYGTSFLKTGPSHSTEGLLRWALRQEITDGTEPIEDDE